jgi:hypothetical protein
MITETGFYYEGFFRTGKFHGTGRIINDQGWIIEGLWEAGLLKNGKITNFNRKVYQGDLQDLQPHGKGSETSPDFEYVGEFFQGKKHGKGKVTWKDKSSYSGDFNAGKIEGFGTHVWEDSQYTGQLKAGKMHGEGVYTWKDGRKYEGSFHAGLREGYGVYIDGESTYQGFWKAGKEDGKGRLETRGKVVEGIWRNGRLQKEKQKLLEENPSKTINLSEVSIPTRFEQKCEKVLEYWKTLPKFSWDQSACIIDDYWRHLSEGVFYGEVNDENLPHGLGIYLTTGWIYEGHFSKGARNGFGRLASSKQETFIGDWSDDKKSGFGVFKKRKNVYVGEWKNDLFEGIGKLKTKKFEYDGLWHKGLQHGKGEMVNPDKTVYFGMFQDGLVMGPGTLVYPNGRKVEAEWNDGKIVKIIKKTRSDPSEKNDESIQGLLKDLIQIKNQDLNGNF